MSYLKLGTIIKTKGLKGEVKVFSSTDFAEERYQKGNIVYLVNEKKGEEIPVHVHSYYFNQGFDYVSFEEMQDINLVEKYLKYDIMVKKEELPPLDKDTYFFSDLKLCLVYDQDGQEIGIVNDVENFTSRATLRISLKGGKELLLPFIKDVFITKVDIENKRIDVKLIEGMVD
jgi:16S rRNA processing protein RimM